MTTYATVEGMLEVLDANPELLEALRARILTREFMELPRMVLELSESQIRLESALREFMEATNTRLYSLESMVAKLSESQIRLESALREFMEATNARLDSLESAVVVLQRDMGEVKETLGVVQQDISAIKGRHVETDLQGKIHGILGMRRMRRVRVVRAGYPAVSLPAFCDSVSESLEEGRITDEEYVRVMDTDLTARARRRGFDGSVYVAVEASNRLDRGDVDRVERTRRILATVFPQSEIRAMVYGVEISDEDRRHAESRGVDTLLERAY